MPRTRSTVQVGGWGVQDPAPDVGHVRHQQGAHFVSDLPQPLVVPLAGVGGPAGDDELGPEVQRLLLQLVVVDVACLQAARGKLAYLFGTIICLLQ